MSRIVKEDSDCADCLCRVCARNTNNDSYNPLEEFPNCSCDHCTLGVSTVIETTDDCPQFLPDIEDESSLDATFGGNGMTLYEEIYKDIVNLSPEGKCNRVASELSFLIHCMKDKKVGDEYVLDRLCACRNAMWDKPLVSEASE